MRDDEAEQQEDREIVPSPRDRKGSKGAINARHDGFTPEKRARFLKTLAKTGCLADGCKVAGVTRETVRRWRAKDADFARACDNAIAMAAAHVETLAWDRAVTGIEEPVYYYGKFSHMRIKRSDAIFRMILMASNPRKYGRMGPPQRRDVEELREELRQEIWAEMHKGRPSTDELRATILAKLADAHKRLKGGGEGEA